MFTHTTKIALAGAAFLGTLATELPTLADRALDGAVYDIYRAESQIAGISPRRTATIKRLQHTIAGARARLETSEIRGSSNWKQAERRLAKLEARLAALTGKPVTNVDASLVTVETWSRTKHVPHPPTRNLNRAAVEAYADKLSEIARTAKRHKIYLASVRGTSQAYSVDYIDSLDHRLGPVLDRSLKQAGQRMVDILEREAARSDRQVVRITAADPKNSEDCIHFLLGREAGLSRSTLQAGLTALMLADAFERRLDVTVTDRSLQRNRFVNALNELTAKQEMALGNVRFPTVRSTNRALLRSASETLKKARVRVGEVLRLEVTENLQRKNRTEGVMGSASSGRISLTRYEWDEFTVTTAEMDAGTVYLFENRFRMFHAAGSSVPIGRWVLIERRKLSPILPENVG